MLLEAAQQRGQAGPAADRHDPRAAGQESLLVDDLDEWLVGVGGPERVGHDAHEPVGPEPDEDEPDARDDQAAQRVRQELERARRR